MINQLLAELEMANRKLKEKDKEIEQLKDLCDKYEEEHNTTFIEWQKDIKANKKAIEYINEMCLCSDGYANYGDDLRPEHIVNILQGKERE